MEKDGKLRVGFSYDDKGQRVKKQSYNASGVLLSTTYYVRDASGTPMAIYTKTGNATKLSEVPVYGIQRLGVWNKEGNATKYELTDHLGNVRAVISEEKPTSLLAKTDYYPFGMAMPSRTLAGGYRYAYQGQEVDPETGKEAFELRLWDSRIGRWLTPDPYGEFYSPYLGMGNNPISTIDPDGGCTTCPGNGTEADPYVLPGVTVTAKRSSPGSDFTDNSFINGAFGQFGAFAFNAFWTHANNNITFGLKKLPDPAIFGKYETAARFGRLAGSLTSIIQGVEEVAGGVAGEIVTVGVATPVAVPLVLHGTATASAGAVGTANEIRGLVYNFSKRNHNGGKQFRGGKQKNRDGYLKSKPKDFVRWFHRYYKGTGAPNASRSVIDDAFREWETLGKPITK